jgi:O-antigen biosynthesis protein
MKYSVIVISFENFSTTTDLLLKSLLSSKSKYEAEIILFDNGSTSETSKQIKLLKGKDKRLKVICNQKNLGFAGGNNQAFKHSKGEVIIFLNSDTITTFSALDRLVEEMGKYSLEILGPLSNAVSGVQKIKIFANDKDLILKEGEFINNSEFSIEPFETDCLSFFCICMNREIYEKLHGLDEEYKMGYYEDTDFCFRARKSGIKLHCTENVFVYHKGEGSFSNVSIGSTIVKNKKRFKRLHRGLKSKKVRDENLDRIKLYNYLISNGNSAPAIEFLLLRRCLLIFQYCPRNIFKKIQYLFNYLSAIKTS